MRKTPRLEAAKRGVGEIGTATEDLIRKCLAALNDPQAETAGLRELVAECAAKLTALAAENHDLRATMNAQLEEIAAMVGTQEAVWPEEVARLQALSEDLRKRAALLADLNP